MWKNIKSTVPKYGRPTEYCEQYFAEYLFQKAIPFENRVNTFLSLIQNGVPEENDH